MNNKYYRITCKGVGIYEYFKKYLWDNNSNPDIIWKNFLNSESTNWLNKPIVYTEKNKNYFSYFNYDGYKMFKEKTLPFIIHYIDGNNIKIEKVNINPHLVVYKDEYQIVVQIDKLIKSREFCAKVKRLAQEYNLSFFVVTEGASAISNNDCEAVKHARNCHIEWEKQNNFDSYENWENDCDE